MADFRILNKSIGFSVRSFMAICFAVTACKLAWFGEMPIEVFVAFVSAVITFYYTKKEERKEDNVK